MALALYACKPLINDDIECVQHYCDPQIADFYGSVDKSIKESFHFSVQVCFDGVCDPAREQSGIAETPNGNSSLPGLNVTPSCGIFFQDFKCKTTDKWLVSTSVGVTPPGHYLPDASLNKAYRVIIKDLDTGKVLVDHEFEGKYMDSTPLGCTANPAHIVCKNLTATWN